MVMESGDAKPQQSAKPHQPSLSLLAELEDRLNQLRSWEQGHGRLVEQMHKQAALIAQKDAEIAERSQKLHQLTSELEARRAEVETTAKQVNEQQSQFDEERRDLDALKQELDQQKQDTEERLHEITREQEELARMREETASHQDHLARQRVKLSGDQEELEKTRKELAGQQEQRKLLLNVKNVLKDSEEEMVRRWATGKAMALITKLVLVVLAAAAFSYAAANRLAVMYTPRFISYAAIELTAVLFGGIFISLFTIWVLAKWKFARKQRVLDTDEKPILNQLNTPDPTSNPSPSEQTLAPSE